VYIYCLVLIAFLVVCVLVFEILIPNDGIRAIYGSIRAHKHRQSIRRPDLDFAGQQFPKPLVDFYLDSPHADQEMLVARGIGNQRYVIKHFLPLDKRLNRVINGWQLPMLPIAITPRGDFYALELGFENESVWVYTVSGQKYLVNPSLGDFLQSVSES
jgi:hypothetical protein